MRSICLKREHLPVFTPAGKMLLTNATFFASILSTKKPALKN